MDEQTAPEDLRLLMRILRGLRNWSQKELAAAAGLDTSSVSRYESGRMVPPSKTVDRLAEAVGIPMSVVEACLLPALKAARLAMASPQALIGLDLEKIADELGNGLAAAGRAVVTAFMIEIETTREEPWEAWETDDEAEE